MTEKTVIQRSNEAVKKEVSSYNALFDEKTSLEARKDNYKTLVANYYSLSTDFYEYGWGKSFHFANRFRGETLEESIQRHESYLALKLNIKSGEKVLDIGCGVGGPLRRIAHLSGAHVTGVTISQYQIQRANNIGNFVLVFINIFFDDDFNRFQAFQQIVALYMVISWSYHLQITRSIMFMLSKLLVMRPKK